MRAIVNTGPGRLVLQEWPTPQPGAGQVRIQTGACAICATDLKMIGGWERTSFPAIPGHEWAGMVDAVGTGVDPGLVGRRCVAENVLADGGEVGFERQACGRQFPNVIEASGSPAAARASLDLVAARGRVLVVGDYDEARADFAWNHLLHQEIELIGSCASAGAWPEAVRLAVEGELPLARLVTHHFPAEQFAMGIRLVRSHQSDVIKVVLEW